ncbi:PUR family DNA/RNA-binding protein [Saprospiraceae bacterium]|nr:PUR family DNA/RNA-binding protein [Saprospiraceae bacterium]MDB4163284.1 PUR family DNA/RNA-binding protein [Saprospiraceae bacterium]
MENHNKESVYSTKVRAGKRRTYFFDVRQTKRDDYYITLTESTKRYEGEGYDRHKIFLYKEDFNRFQKHLSDTIDHVKTELLPDFDYEQYERRQAEWEASLDENGNPPPRPEVVETKDAEKAPAVEEAPSTNEPSATDSEEDMSW